MEFQLILGAIGTIQSFFMSLFIYLGKKRNVQNVLLCLLFFFLGVRILKSTLWLHLEFVSDIVLNIGFIAHVCTGPILFLYLKYFFSGKRWNHFDFLHFLPSLTLLLFITQINESNFWFLGGYSSLLYHQMGYTIVSILLVLYFKVVVKITFSKKEWIWILILLIGISSIQAAYFSNYILGLVPYSMAPISYAFFIFFLSLFGVLNQTIFEKVKKYTNIRLSEDQLEEYILKIETIMKEEKLFLDSNFTLSKLSKKISTPPYLTSHILNEGLNISFSDYLNSFRIEEAKVLLLSEKYKNVKISEVAYECGFNSLSTFNSNFKRGANMTPSQFRKQHFVS